jgi:hypothetical protein
MKEFKFYREPKVRRSDIDRLNQLLVVFDEVGFNTDAEFVATAEITVPVFGPVVVSLYDREKHFKIYPKGCEPSNGRDLHNGEHYDLLDTRDDLVELVKNILAEEVVKKLLSKKGAVA